MRDRRGLRVRNGAAACACRRRVSGVWRGAGHVAGAAVEDQDLARELLGLPGDRFLAYPLSVGYPAGPAMPGAVGIMPGGGTAQTSSPRFLFR